MILDRDKFLAVDDSDYAYVEIPESLPQVDYERWLEDPTAVEVPQVRVRSLTGDQRSRLYTRADLDDKANAPPGYWRALCCAMGMVDDKGAYLFPNEIDGANRIGAKHPELVERIAVKIQELSKMTKASRAALEKKSQKATTSSGGTSSPEQSPPVTDSASTS